MNNEMPKDPRLENLDEEIAEIIFQEFKRNIDLVAIHLRDARNMLYGVQDDNNDRALCKAVLLLGAAALESNLVYFSGAALRISENRTGLFFPGQIRYLRGIEEVVDENGKLVEKPARQSLSDRLQIVPTLLARTVQRTYQLKARSAAVQKLVRTIMRRDAIVHPRADRYITELGWWEAAEAIDSVELYLDSVRSALHPYLVGYFPVLYTIPGHDHHEVAVGHRTFGKKGPKRLPTTMGDSGLLEVGIGEWRDSILLILLALSHGCEGDSQGSMFTRAALIVLYAMLDAELSVMAQWRMAQQMDAFREAEVLFLNEWASGVGHDGELSLSEDHQSFKKRIKAIPAILSRCVEGKELNVDLGRQWGKDLIDGKALRDAVMHSEFDQPLARVSKQELIRSAKAVFAYFEELVAKSPVTFEYLSVVLKAKPTL